MFKIESKFTKCKKKIQEIFFVSEIKASENVAKIGSVKKKMLVIRSQWVNKQS